MSNNEVPSAPEAAPAGTDAEKPADSSVDSPVDSSAASSAASPADQPDTTPEAAPSAAEDPSPLRGVFTPSMVTLLSTLGRSVLVSTYQAGKLVMLRVKDGVLNTHYRNFSRPMGLDATLKDVAIGTRQDVVFFENVPAVIPRIEPAGATAPGIRRCGSTPSPHAATGRARSPTLREISPPGARPGRRRTGSGQRQGRRATASISTPTSRGRRATSTVERAGL